MVTLYAITLNNSSTLSPNLQNYKQFNLVAVDEMSIYEIHINMVFKLL